MDMILGLSAEKLTGWDGIIIAAIIALMEWVIKPLFKNADEKTWKIVCKVAPVVLGALVYLVIALIQKGNILNSVLHGLFVGLSAMGSYDAVVRTIKEKGITAAKDINDAVIDAVKKDDNEIK